MPAGKFLNGFNPALDKTQRCPAGWTEFEPLVKVGLHTHTHTHTYMHAYAHKCCHSTLLSAVLDSMCVCICVCVCARGTQPYIMHYWDTSFTRNCGPTYIVRNQYTTDVLLNKTLSYIL